MEALEPTAQPQANIPASEERLTISEAARRWGCSRDAVKSWVKAQKVEAQRDNSGVWRIALGQQPPPSLALHRQVPRKAGLLADGSADTPNSHPRDIPGTNGSKPKPPQDSPLEALAMEPAAVPRDAAATGEPPGKVYEDLAAAWIAKAEAERDRDIARREIELLRERLEAQGAEMDRLHELLRDALAPRPGFLERLVRALRGPRIVPEDAAKAPRSHVESHPGAMASLVAGSSQSTPDGPPSAS